MDDAMPLRTTSNPAAHRGSGSRDLISTKKCTRGAGL